MIHPGYAGGKQQQQTLDIRRLQVDATSSLPSGGREDNISVGMVNAEGAVWATPWSVEQTEATIGPRWSAQPALWLAKASSAASLIWSIGNFQSSEK